jgi:hypothetical protein
MGAPRAVRGRRKVVILFPVAPTVGSPAYPTRDGAAMVQVVQFPLQGGGSVLVQADDAPECHR